MQKGNHCPLIGKKCIEHKCAWYYQIRGRNPNTGQEVDEWQCSVNLLPLLLIENSNQQRCTAAAVESFRNESVKTSQNLNQILAHGINRIDTLPPPIQPATVKILNGDG
jgi:hypothetical protein